MENFFIELRKRFQRELKVNAYEDIKGRSMLRWSPSARCIEKEKKLQHLITLIDELESKMREVNIFPSEYIAAPHYWEKIMEHGLKQEEKITDLKKKIAELKVKHEGDGCNKEGCRNVNCWFEQPAKIQTILDLRNRKPIIVNAQYIPLLDKLDKIDELELKLDIEREKVDRLELNLEQLRKEYQEREEDSKDEFAFVKRWLIRKVDFLNIDIGNVSRGHHYCNICRGNAFGPIRKCDVGQIYDKIAEQKEALLNIVNSIEAYGKLDK
jgi:hypothetical protein